MQHRFLVRVARHALTAIAVVVLSAQIGAAPAAANDGGPQLVYENPNPGNPNDVLRIYKDVGKSTRTARPAAATAYAAASACWSISPDIYAIDGYGTEVWRLTENINWCGDGTNITYYYRWTQSRASGNWVDQGSWADSVSYPETGYSMTSQRHTQHFNQCSPSPWGMYCWDDRYPWVSADVYGYGGYSSNAGY